MAVDSVGEGAITPQDCQYLYTGLLTAKNTQTNVTIQIVGTTSHPTLPWSTCSNNMYTGAWAVPDPYPANFMFF